MESRRVEIAFEEWFQGGGGGAYECYIDFDGDEDPEDEAFPGYVVGAIFDDVHVVDADYSCYADTIFWVCQLRVSETDVMGKYADQNPSRKTAMSARFGFLGSRRLNTVGKGNIMMTKSTTMLTTAANISKVLSWMHVCGMVISQKLLTGLEIAS
jgi:hypothetical protein